MQQLLLQPGALKCALHSDPAGFSAAKQSMEALLTNVGAVSGAFRTRTKPVPSEPFVPRSGNTYIKMPFNSNFAGRAVPTVPFVHPDRFAANVFLCKKTPHIILFANTVVGLQCGVGRVGQCHDAQVSAR